MKIISIANDFSPVPAGRSQKDGPNSGERFRGQLLLPSLNSGATCVKLDAEGYGSSFLEEAFGGLVRVGLSHELIRKNLSIE